MSDWQDADPRATNGMEEMDNRRSYVGRTLVYSDRHGPYQFWRNGVQVPCVCDPEKNLVCKYHAPPDIEGKMIKPREAPEPPAAGEVPFKSAEERGT